MTGNYLYKKVADIKFFSNYDQLMLVLYTSLGTKT